MPAMQRKVLPPNLLKNEGGFVMVMTMMVLLLVTVIGLTMIDTSTFELKFAGNDKSARTALYMADSSAYTTPKLIVETLTESAEPSYPNLVWWDEAAGAYVANDPNNVFYQEVSGFVDLNLGQPEFRLTMTDGLVDCDLVGQQAGQNVGGGAEFASGAAGFGVGSVGGANLTFDINCTGTTPNNSQANVQTRYRKILGAAGGL